MDYLIHQLKLLNGNSQKTVLEELGKEEPISFSLILPTIPFVVELQMQSKQELQSLILILTTSKPSCLAWKELLNRVMRDLTFTSTMYSQ